MKQETLKFHENQVSEIWKTAYWTRCPKLVKLVNYYFHYMPIIIQLKPLSSYGVPAYQISFWYPITNKSFNSETIFLFQSLVTVAFFAGTQI